MKVTAALMAAFVAIATFADERLNVNWSPTVEEAQAFADAVAYSANDRSVWDGSVNIDRQCEQPFTLAGQYEPILHTPLCAIESMSLDAQKGYETLTVTEEMIPPPGLRVVAMPPSGVNRSYGYRLILLKSTDRQLIVKPADMDTIAIPFGNKMGYETEYNSVVALFTPEQIAEVQAADRKGEFYIVTVNDAGKERETKLKTKHFKHLR